ncbi:MAG: hypothetical protein AAEJ04_07675 [Planctomycetota bacterium]
MSMRAFLSLVLLFLTSLLVSPVAAEASGDRHTSISKRASKRFGCRLPAPRQRVRGCTLHQHNHDLSPGITYFNRSRVCLRKLPCGTVQRWKPASTRIEYRKVQDPPRCQTVVRYRTTWRCGVRIRTPYTETIMIPGRIRKVAQQVVVPGAWIPYKKVSRRYGSQFSFLRYPSN